MEALNQRAPIYLRANSYKWSRAEVVDWLASKGIDTPLPNSQMLCNWRLTIAFPMPFAGRVEIQDLGSQMIAPLLQAQAGETIIDSCAGAGGKTLHFGQSQL